MTPERKAEVRKIVAHFRGIKMPITNEVITEWCNKNGIKEPISKGQLSDYIYQMENDEKMSKMLPVILQLFLDHMTYVGEFASEKEEAARREKMVDLKIKLVQLLEENDVPYHWAQKLYEEFGSQIKQTLDSAGTVATNKATEVMLHIAREKFDGEINMGHVAQYAREVFEKAADKKKEKPADAEVEAPSDEEVPAPEEEVAETPDAKPAE